MKFLFKTYNARRIGQASWPLKGFGQSKKQKLYNIHYTLLVIHFFAIKIQLIALRTQ